MSPCDSHHLHEIWLNGEQVSEQASRLASDADADGQVDLVPASEYGVTGPDGWTYSIPISRTALLSIIDGPPFHILHADSLAQPVSNAPAFVYMGTEDAIRGSPLNEMTVHVRRLVPAAQVFTVKHGDHSLTGCETAVADAISAWAYHTGLLSES